MNLDIYTIDWIAISAFASFAMVVITWFSLRLMKRQWNEEKRPRLNFSIAISQVWYVLKISNIGKQNAYNIDIDFNQEFIDILSPVRKSSFERLETKSFAIEAGCSKYYLISSCEEWKSACSEIIVKGKYCNKYKIDEKIYIDEFITDSLIVNDALTTDIGYIKKGLIVQNDKYYPIQKSLDIIAKKLSEERNDNH